MEVKPPVNILMVDDEPANLLALEAILTPLGANLVLAHSGPEALKHVLSTDFAAILLDVRMPGMTGFEVATLIRNRPRSSSIPIIFLTAYSDSEEISEEAYSLGAVDFLTKPVKASAVRAKVAVFVDLHRKTQELQFLEAERHAALIQAKDERIRLIFENAREYAFIGTDPAGLIREWQAGARAITGWEVEEVVGKSLSMIYSAEDRAAGKFESDLALARSTGNAREKRWREGRDKPFFADGVVIPLYDNAKQLQGYATIFRDATAEHVAEEKAKTALRLLEASEERLRLATWAGGLAVWTWFPHSDEMVWEIESHTALFGRDSPPPRSRSELLSQVDDRDAEAMLEVLAMAMQSDKPFLFQARLIERGQEDLGRWVELTGKAHAGPGGGRDFLLGTIAEITERKLAEQKLAQLAGNLAEVDRLKTEFLATAAHELRNPLAPLTTGLNLLEVSSDDPALIGRVRPMLQRQVKLMARLIDDLLDVGRINGNKLELKKEHVAVQTVIQHALESSRPLIDAAGHEVCLNLPEDETLLHVDPVRVAQVLNNIINNAAKYTPPGGRISIGTVLLGPMLGIEVIDNGVGIAPSAIANVFTMFNQVDEQLHRAQGGLGIGLALARNLVELHEGRLEVRSDGAGTGSTFVVWLPLACTSSVSMERIPARKRARSQGPTRTSAMMRP